jgi:hypothetical protein
MHTHMHGTSTVCALVTARLHTAVPPQPTFVTACSAMCTTPSASASWISRLGTAPGCIVQRLMGGKLLPLGVYVQCRTRPDEGAVQLHW